MTPATERSHAADPAPWGSAPVELDEEGYPESGGEEDPDVEEMWGRMPPTHAGCDHCGSPLCGAPATMDALVGNDEDVTCLQCQIELTRVEGPWIAA